MNRHTVPRDRRDLVLGNERVTHTARALTQGHDRGFTLIELLVVVIIIGILAAIAIPVYLNVQLNAKDGAVKSDLHNAKTAVVAKFTNDGAYPSDLTGLSAQGYTQSAASNYYSNTATDLPKLTSSGKAFCIQAKSAAGTPWAVSDTVPLGKGTCSATGVFVGA